MMENKKLKALIQEKNLTYRKLGEISGVPAATINRICTGTHDNPKINTIKKIADALGVTVNDLIY